MNIFKSPVAGFSSFSDVMISGDTSLNGEPPLSGSLILPGLRAQILFTWSNTSQLLETYALDYFCSITLAGTIIMDDKIALCAISNM